MKFFTPEFYFAQYNDDQASLEALRKTYDDAHWHILTLSLPEEILAIADPFYVDDALVASVRQSDDPVGLELVLRRGNLQIGYSDLALKYETPEVDDESLQGLLRVANNARSEVRYGMTDAYCHEIDLDSEGRLVHSILFHSPPGEPPTIFTVKCSNLKVAERLRSGRSLPPFRRRYRIARFNASSVSIPPDEP